LIDPLFDRLAQPPFLVFLGTIVVKSVQAAPGPPIHLPLAKRPDPARIPFELDIEFSSGVAIAPQDQLCRNRSWFTAKRSEWFLSYRTGQTVMDGVSSSRTSRAWLPLALWVFTLALAMLAGCGTYIGTTSTSFLRVINKEVDPNVRFIAYDKLGTKDLYASLDEKNAAVDTLIKKYNDGKEPLAIRAVILRSLGNLGDKRARPLVLKATSDTDANIRAEACRALGKVGTPEDAATLAQIMTTDTLEDCRIAAIEGIGALKADDSRISEMLLEGMEHDDPAIRYACLESLRKLTGKDYGIEVAAWRRELFPGTVPKKIEPPNAGRSVLSFFKKKDNAPTAPKQAVALPPLPQPGTVDPQVITTKQN
jgi:HEAT repeats